MPFRELLEEYPLYRKYAGCPWHSLDQVDKPTIHMYCLVCKSEQTFFMVNQYYEGYEYSNVPIDGLSVRAVYRCVGCDEYSRYFFIKFDEAGESVMKVGQDPAWSIAIEHQLERMLGPHADTYRKGLICESQGYGIGAYGYYRRIVEEIIDQLLDEIASLIPPAEQSTYAIALAKTKSTHITHEKIDLVKDLLPPLLRPEGLNPLSVLHGSLSAGLHSQPDERCVELAATTREALTFLVHQVLAHKTAAKKFTESIKKLLLEKKRND
jgi:hypothetical protein